MTGLLETSTHSGDKRVEQDLVDQEDPFLLDDRRILMIESLGKGLAKTSQHAGCGHFSIHPG